MTTILAVGEDDALWERCSGLAQMAGYRIVSHRAADALQARSPDGTICIYDLGSRGAADTGALQAAAADHRQIRFIALSARPQAAEGLQLLAAGVRGYCNRLASLPVLAAVIAAVEAGEIWAGRQLTEHLLAVALAGPVPDDRAAAELLGQLTPREMAIAQQVAAGASNKVIAADKAISERTVKAHLNSIFRKTGLRSRVQLALAVSSAATDQRRLHSA